MADDIKPGILDKLISFVTGGKLAAVLTKLQGFMRGKKTYLVGVVTILQAVVGLWGSVESSTTGADVVALVRNLGDNPDWKMLLAGIAMLTIRSAITIPAPPTTEVTPK